MTRRNALRMFFSTCAKLSVMSWVKCICKHTQEIRNEQWTIVSFYESHWTTCGHCNTYSLRKPACCSFFQVLLSCQSQFPIAVSVLHKAVRTKAIYFLLNSRRGVSASLWLPRPDSYKNISAFHSEAKTIFQMLEANRQTDNFSGYFTFSLRA